MAAAVQRVAIEAERQKDRVDVNSLTNIAYITQLTNIRISDKNTISPSLIRASFARFLGAA